MKIGKISNKILRRTVLKNMGSGAGFMERGVCPGMGATVFGEGVFEGKRGVMATESGIEAVIKACNNVWAKGAVPRVMQVSVTMPPQDREIRLREITQGIADDCRRMGVEYAGGHTQVSDDVVRTVISATCVGVQMSGEELKAACSDVVEGLSEDRMGELKAVCGDDVEGLSEDRMGEPQGADKSRSFTGEDVKVGDLILLTKWIGIGGVRHIIEKNRALIEQRYRDEVIDTAYGKREYMMIGDEAKLGALAGVSYMMPLSYGGVYAGLNDLADLTGLGFDVDFRAIPVCQEIIEICEMFDINPYELESSGCLLMTFDSKCDIMKLLHENGIPVCVIGKVAEAGVHAVHNNDETYHLEYTSHDEIYM